MFLLLGPQTVSGAYPMRTWGGRGGSFPGVKRKERKAEHSPLTTAVVKKSGAIPPLPNTPSLLGV
jgi:hypothetical protein